ncbi:MAG: hypothetical protein Q9170_003038 [Blastenia crenularia]
MEVTMSPTSASASLNQQVEPHSDQSELSQQYPPPAPEPMTSFAALKDRIKYHYDNASDYYYSLWGEHVHHGYFLEPDDTKERAQIRLVELLLDRSKLEKGSSVLDVGCGLGGTSRYLAKHRACDVTGITISGKQVDMAERLTTDIVGANKDRDAADGSIKFDAGSVSFMEFDAEKLGEFVSASGIWECVWISEAMSHLPDKQLFFNNAIKLLRPNGRLVVADWFKAEDLTSAQLEADIKPIEGMLG